MKTENQNNMTPEEILRKHLEALENDTEGAYSSSEIDNYCLRAMREYGSQQFTAGVEAGKREELQYWLQLSNLETDLKIKVNEDYYAAMGIALVHGYKTDPKLIEECDKIRAEINKLKVRYGLASPPNPDKGGKEKDNG